MGGLSSNPRWSIKLLTEAARLPVSLQEVKAHLGIEDSIETFDANLMGEIRASTGAVESYLRRSLVDTTWTMWMDRFPGKPLPWWDGVRQGADTELTDLTEAIYLPKPPLSSITHVKAHKQDGTETTVSSANYIVDLAGEPGRVALTMTSSWPTDSLRAINGVEVEFVAGYGPVGSDVPAAIRHELLLWIADVHSKPDGTGIRSEKTGESAISNFSQEQLPLRAQNKLIAYRAWEL